MNRELLIQPRPINPVSILPRPIQRIEPRPITSQQVVVSRDPNVTDEELRITQSVTDPKLFAQIYLQTELWDMQCKILDAITVSNSRTVVKACHASSKTFTAAIATLWFIARYPEAIVITTAPTWGQVEKLLWGEIHSALLRTRIAFPQATKTKLQLGPKRYAMGLATSVTKEDEGVKFQGFHAEHVLVILDEAPGVNPKIWDAIEGARAGGDTRILAIGNPTISSGPFHDAFVNQRADWNTFTIDAFDTPNLKGITLEQLIDPNISEEELKKEVCPYLVKRQWVREKYFAWGPGHPSWESRVRGNFPKQAPDALMNLTWLELAAIKDVNVKSEDEVIAGLDVAGPGEDETSLTIRKGPKLLLHEQTAQADPRGWVVERLNEFRGLLKAVNVDSIGIGWGMYQHLLDLKFPANPVNVCERSNDPEKFADIKSEYYWGLRERFKAGDISGLLDGKKILDEETIGQLAGIRYKQNSRGQVEIESKEDARARGVKSPDKAESVMLAFASRTAVYGFLDYVKQVQMEKVQESRLIKPLTSDNQLFCPSCSAVCIVVCANGWRCNQCGNQWSKESKQPVLGARRGEYLAKMSAPKGILGE